MTTLRNPYRYVTLCAWGGPIVLVISIVFWALLGQNVPPYSAALDAQTFATQFREKAVLIRIGMDGMIVGGVFYMIWSLAIMKVMEAIERENGDNNVMSAMQMWGGGLTTMIFVIPSAIWLTATFRAETMNPEMLQMLYDLGWMLFDMAFSLTSAQYIAFGVCFLGDKRAVPLMPRWVCWLGIYVALMFLVLVLMPFFHGGPFSRAGVINYFVEFGIFFLFMIVASYYLLKAVPRLEQEHARGLTKG